MDTPTFIPNISINKYFKIAIIKIQEDNLDRQNYTTLMQFFIFNSSIIPINDINTFISYFKLNYNTIKDSIKSFYDKNYPVDEDIEELKNIFTEAKEEGDENKIIDTHIKYALQLEKNDKIEQSIEEFDTILRKFNFMRSLFTIQNKLNDYKITILDKSYSNFYDILEEIEEYYTKLQCKENINIDYTFEEKYKKYMQSSS